MWRKHGPNMWSIPGSKVSEYHYVTLHHSAECHGNVHILCSCKAYSIGAARCMNSVFDTQGCKHIIKFKEEVLANEENTTKLFTEYLSCYMEAHGLREEEMDED